MSDYVYLCIYMSLLTAVNARWTRVCPVCVSLYLRACVLVSQRDEHMYVRFACLYMYEHVYCCHSEMSKCMYGLLYIYEHVYCCHCEMDTCMSGLRVSISMSMCTVVKARWTRVCPVCVSLYL